MPAIQIESKKPQNISHFTARLGGDQDVKASYCRSKEVAERWIGSSYSSEPTSGNQVLNERKSYGDLRDIASIRKRCYLIAYI